VADAERARRLEFPTTAKDRQVPTSTHLAGSGRAADGGLDLEDVLFSAANDSIDLRGAPLGDLSYTWDANKNKTGESIGGVMSGYGFTADYDAEDRLVSWDRADTNLDQSWDLSPVGNWNSITENAAVQNRTHGPVHELLTAAGQSVEHDPKGNITLLPSSLRSAVSRLSLKWDFDNKLRAADTNDDGIDDIFYRWDALGRRVGRHDGTNHVIYFQDGQQTIADYAAGIAAGSPTYTYIYARYIDEPVVRNGGGLHYYHRNEQCSIVAVTTSAGAIAERYAFEAYGGLTILDSSATAASSSAINNRYTYTGREWDPDLSLYHYRARMYAPAAGRFCSRDPIGFAGRDWHLYQYVSSNPIIGRDPHGLYQLPWWLARIVAQIPIVNIVNAVLQELPGTDVSDYSGCEPDWGCDHDPASWEFSCFTPPYHSPS
jgi:RHS repeat-associated protein